MNTSTHSKAMFACIAIILLMLLAMPATACPFCSETVAQQKGTGLAAGLSYSVIGMASMPFVLFGTVAGIIIRAYRQHRRSQPDDFDESQLN